MTLTFDCRHRYASGFELAAAFEAGPGVTALFGPSGGGKTTTLNLIAGILLPSQGRIELAGRVLFDHRQRTNLPPDDRQVALVFQDYLLFPHLTVERNLTFGLRRRPARQIGFDRVVQLLEIADILTRLPHTLSGGQRQRVALGRAILRGPSLLLMDEPLAALDAALKGRVLTYLERILDEWHIPTLLVCHDQSDVRRLADRVVVLQGGKVVASGEPNLTLEQIATG